MRREYSTHESEAHTKFWYENLQESDYHEDLSVGWKMISKWI
jgi:hypothetical protein